MKSLSEYFRRHPDLARGQRLAVSYVSHQRQAFRIRNETGELEFRLAPPSIGIASLNAGDDLGSLLAPGAFNVVAHDADGVRYESTRARTPARINIFRHGPHYYDVHVFDLALADGDGQALPVRGELVFHVYPAKLYYELILHVTGEARIARVHIEFPMPGDVEPGLRSGQGAATLQEQDGAFRLEPASAGTWVAATMDGRGTWGWMATDPEGTLAVEYLRREDGRALLLHEIDPGGPSPALWTEGRKITAAARLLAIAPALDGPAEIASEASVEADPLTAEQIRLGGEGLFEGYDLRRGYYTLSTPAGHALNWYYRNPHFMSWAPLTVQNNDRARRVYFRHRDRDRDGRVEAGVVTDADGFALPVLVQNSKNFSGEHEEKFYDPGDPAYSESYYPLELASEETLNLRSYHAKFNWGRHPLKQIGSLQAWMPYYQMSLGVTETTCWVPFRFWGHDGIFMADLRGISGSMWGSQPQFDNVGGHRLLHYRTGEDRPEHFLRYLSSHFRFTGPNMAHLRMEYLTDDGAAHVEVVSYEPPQTDETRNFVQLRITFKKPLTITDPALNLRLISIDTHQQTLRYQHTGFTGPDGAWQERAADTVDELPVGALLSTNAPAVALYRCTPQSKQRGNNALIVQRFEGTASGQPLDRLAYTVLPRGAEGAERIAFLTLPGDEIRFEPGDTIALDLIVMPYGSTGTDEQPVLAERMRWALHPPRVEVEHGTRIAHWPPTVRVDAAGRVDFTVAGGYNIIPLLIEGLAGYQPPHLEVWQEDQWQPVRMTEGGHEGFHCYLDDEGTFGHVFLHETDGTPQRFRIGSE